MNISDQDHAKWHEFLDKLNIVIRDVFGEDNDVLMILGMAFGDMRNPETDGDVCVVSTNIAPHGVGQAFVDMATTYDRDQTAATVAVTPVIVEDATTDEEIAKLRAFAEAKYGVTINVQRRREVTDPVILGLIEQWDATYAQSQQASIEQAELEALSPADRKAREAQMADDFARELGITPETVDDDNGVTDATPNPED